MKPTKIEKIETILWDRWLLVRIYCEDGTVGIGEPHTFLGQPINVWRFVKSTPVATHIRPAKVIH